MSNAAFPAAGTYRVTASWRASNGTLIDQRTSTFYAGPGEAYITLTIDKGSIAFGTVDPGVALVGGAVTITISSSAPFDLIKETTGQNAEMGLSTTLPSTLAGQLSGTRSYVDTFSIDIPWTTDSGVPLSASVAYTVVQ